MSLLTNRPMKTIAAQLLVIALSTMVISSCAETGMESSGTVFEVSSSLSDLNVKCFAEDSRGALWIGTERGLNRLAYPEFYHYLYDPLKERSISNSNINDLFVDSRGRMWAVTISGICLYTENDDFYRPFHNIERLAARQLIETEDGHLIMLTSYGVSMLLSQDSDRLDVIYSDEGKQLPAARFIAKGDDDRFWLVDDSKLYEFDLSQRRIIQELKHGFEDIAAISEDRSGLLWIYGGGRLAARDLKRAGIEVGAPRTISGLCSGKEIEGIFPCGDVIIFNFHDVAAFYYPSDGITIMSDDPKFPYELPDFHPTCFYIDSCGNLWVGSSSSGYVLCPAAEPINPIPALRRNCSNLNVMDVDRDNDDRLWILTRNGDIIHTDSNMETRLLDTGGLGISRANQFAYDRRDDTVWIGCDNNLVHAKAENSGLSVISSWKISGRVVRIVPYGNGTQILAGTSDGHIYNISQSSCDSVKVSRTRIYDIAPLSDGTMAISAFRDDLYILNPSTMHVSRLPYRDVLGEMYHIQVIKEIRPGILALGTLDYGLYLYSLDTHEAVKIESLSCSAIESIEIDNSGDAWIGTQYGLNQYDLKQGLNIMYGISDSDFPGKYSLRASCILSNGIIVFGGTHGITLCDPSLNSSIDRYPLTFEGLKVNGINVSPADSSCMEKPIWECGEIHLTHNQRNVSISFSSSRNSKYTPMYRYTLDNRGGKWTEIGNENSIFFSKLPYGRHTLLIEELAPYGEIGKQAALEFIVKRPYLLSQAAISLYTIAAMFLAAVLITFRQRSVNAKRSLEQAKKEKEEEIEYNRQYNDFVVNLVHELRSPLTMITGPISSFEKKDGLEESDRKFIRMMRNSTNRMLKLMSQLLDYKRFEYSTVPLEVIRNYRLTPHLAMLVEDLRITASTIDTEVELIIPEDDIILPLDVDKFDSIMTNLFSNAVKHADPEEGIIQVKASRSGSMLNISVSNNGPTLTDDEKEQIFERFRTIKHHKADNQIGWVSTGVGLNYARNLARIMHGTLTAENIGSDKGVAFILTLPLDETEFNPQDFISDIPCTPQGQGTASNRPEGGLTGTDRSNLSKILLIDDNPQMLDYISALLEPAYNVKSCNDPMKALELIKSDYIPDVIISDVAMPGMNGIELCSRIKNNIVTCHIPVILVTGVDSIDSKVRGLEIGADAYISKPFEPSDLLAEIKSLIKNRNILKSSILGSTSTLNIDGKLLGYQDIRLLESIYSSFEKELDNPDFDMNALAGRLNMSRSKLHYKIKGLTDHTPNAFFNIYRMNAALQMLKKGYSVSEVADRTGFSTASYFTRAFKKHFGILPKYAKEKMMIRK